MKCDQCGVQMVKKMATDTAPYGYAESGLDNVFLCGIIVHRCPQCRAESPVIPKIGELHRVIARVLVHKPTLLTGKELRFLRKNEGFPATKFSTLLEVDPSHLSRIENGRTKSLGASADRLARALVMAASSGEAAREVLLRLADELKKPRKTKRPGPVFKLERNRWKLAA